MVKSKVLVGVFCLCSLIILMPVTSAVHRLPAYEQHTAAITQAFNTWKKNLEDDEPQYPLLTALLFILMIANSMFGGYIKAHYGVNPYFWIWLGLTLYGFIGMLLSGVLSPGE